MQYLHFLMALSKGQPNSFLLFLFLSLPLPISLYHSLLMLKTIPPISPSFGIFLWFICATTVGAQLLIHNGKWQTKKENSLKESQGIFRTQSFSLNCFTYQLGFVQKFYQYLKMKKVKFIKKSLVC